MDLFRLLGSGATFNKQRFQNDVEIFESTPNAGPDVTQDTEARDQLLDELDFFKTTHTVVDAKKGKKDKATVVDKTPEDITPTTNGLSNTKDITDFRKD
ncbi:unnamed protein product [Absidia cylindrospora]